MKTTFPIAVPQHLTGKQLLVLTVAFLFSAILGLYSTRCGPLITADSLNYLSAAVSFKRDFTFLSTDGTYYTYWPPLLPIILSFFSQPLVALLWIHLLTLLVFTFTSWNLAQMFFNTKFSQNLFFILSIVNVHIIMIFSFVWSELIFMTIAFLNLYCLLKIKERRSYFVAALITGFFLCLQRNAGLFWIMGSCCWIVFIHEGKIRKKLAMAVTLFITSTIGLWIWNIHRTFFVPADFAFYRLSFFNGFWQNLYLAGISIGGIFAPVSYLSISGYLFIVALSVLIFFSLRDCHPQFTLVSFIVIFYIGCFVSLGSLDQFEMDRYFSVVVPLIIALFLRPIDGLFSWLKDRWRLGLVAVIMGWFLFPVIRTLNNAERWHERSCSQEINE